MATDPKQIAEILGHASEAIAKAFAETDSFFKLFKTDSKKFQVQLNTVDDAINNAHKDAIDKTSQLEAFHDKYARKLETEVVSKEASAALPTPSVKGKKGGKAAPEEAAPTPSDLQPD